MVCGWATGVRCSYGVGAALFVFSDDALRETAALDAGFRPFAFSSTGSRSKVAKKGEIGPMCSSSGVRISDSSASAGTTHKMSLICVPSLVAVFAFSGLKARGGGLRFVLSAAAALIGALGEDCSLVDDPSACLNDRCADEDGMASGESKRESSIAGPVLFPLPFLSEGDVKDAMLLWTEMSPLCLWSLMAVAGAAAERAGTLWQEGAAVRQRNKLVRSKRSTAR